MLGFFWMQFSIAVCDGVCLPAAVADTAICLSFPLIPNPLRKPVVTELAYGRSCMLVEHRDRHPLALRRRTCVPADQHAGVEVVGGEERVDRSRRAGRRVERDHQHALALAFLIAAFSAFASATVIRIPFTPRSAMFSIAAIWPRCRSCSCRRRRSTPHRAFLAAEVAPAAILTKNGFVTSFVISPTLCGGRPFAVGLAAAAETTAALAARTRSARKARTSMDGGRLPADGAFPSSLPFSAQIVVPITQVRVEESSVRSRNTMNLRAETVLLISGMSPSNPTTIKDVARLSGVSSMTVSRVINGRERVSPETRQRVEQAISELGYVPSRLARGLIRQKTGTLALIVPDVANPFFTLIVRGAEDVARRADYRMILCDTRADLSVERDVIEELLAHRVEGIAIAPVSDRSDMHLRTAGASSASSSSSSTGR